VDIFCAKNGLLIYSNRPDIALPHLFLLRGVLLCCVYMALTASMSPEKNPYCPNSTHSITKREREKEERERERTPPSFHSHSTLEGVLLRTSSFMPAYSANGIIT
jgi:hypothetical protein